MSKNITKEESESLKQAFSLYDRDGDGAITVKEFGDILKSLNVNGSAQEIDSIVKSVDSNQDGSIDFNEFVMAMTRHLPPPSKNSDQHPKEHRRTLQSTKKRLSVHEDDELKQCFHAFDKNGDGFISLDELEEVMSKLGEQLSKQELKDMLEDADTNRDGLIDYKEFRKLMPKGL